MLPSNNKQETKKLTYVPQKKNQTYLNPVQDTDSLNLQSKQQKNKRLEWKRSLYKQMLLSPHNVNRTYDSRVHWYKCQILNQGWASWPQLQRWERSILLKQKPNFESKQTAQQSLLDQTNKQLVISKRISSKSALKKTINSIKNPKTIASITQVEWQWVVDSISAGFKLAEAEESFNKVHRYYKPARITTESRELWNSLTPDEKLQEVQRAPYPNSLHSTVYTKLSVNGRDRFMELRGQGQISLTLTNDDYAFAIKVLNQTPELIGGKAPWYYKKNQHGPKTHWWSTLNEDQKLDLLKSPLRYPTYLFGEAFNKAPVYQKERFKKIAKEEVIKRKSINKSKTEEATQLKVVEKTNVTAILDASVVNNSSVDKEVKKSDEGVEESEEEQQIAPESIYNLLKAIVQISQHVEKFKMKKLVRRVKVDDDFNKKRRYLLALFSTTYPTLQTIKYLQFSLKCRIQRVTQELHNWVKTRQLKTAFVSRSIYYKNTLERARELQQQKKRWIQQYNKTAMWLKVSVKKGICLHYLKSLFKYHASTSYPLTKEQNNFFLKVANVQTKTELSKALYDTLKYHQSHPSWFNKIYKLLIALAKKYQRRQLKKPIKWAFKKSQLKIQQSYKKDFLPNLYLAWESSLCARQVKNKDKIFKHVYRYQTIRTAAPQFSYNKHQLLDQIKVKNILINGQKCQHIENTLLFKFLTYQKVYQKILSPIIPIRRLPPTQIIKFTKKYKQKSTIVKPSKNQQLVKSFIISKFKLQDQFRNKKTLNILKSYNGFGKLYLLRHRYNKNHKVWRFIEWKYFLKKKGTNYRHIYKNRLYLSLFRGQIHHIFKCKETDFMRLWFTFRRGHNRYWGMTNLVQKFSQSLLLTLPNVALLLNIAPSLGAARALVKLGGISINGCAIINQTFYLKPGNILTITPELWEITKRHYFYSRQKWANIQQTRITYLSFFQIDWSMLMFTMIAWPRPYELTPPKFLSERWVRYYISNFPARIKRYKTVKLVWKDYPFKKKIKNPPRIKNLNFTPAERIELKKQQKQQEQQEQEQQNSN